MMRRFLTTIRRDEGGSTIIEFALLAPVVFGMFFGLIQLGISLQAYSSLRGVSSDTARWAVVQYMNQNEVTDAQIKTQAETIAKAAPYMLNDTVAVTITPATTPRVPGTHEKTMLITYTPPNVLPFFDYVSGQQSFQRPIFVLDE